MELLGNLVFLEKYRKCQKVPTCPLYVPQIMICAKTNQILYNSFLVNKQNENHVHPNDTNGLKDGLKINHVFRKIAILGNWSDKKPHTQLSQWDFG